MSETETAVPMDDKALFDAATAPDAPQVAEAPVTEATIEQADAGPARDEHGRFAPKVEAQPAAEAPKVEAPAQSVVQPPAPQAEARHEPPPGWIPAWRAREMVEAERRKFDKPAEPIDPYVDPEKFRDAGVRQAIDPVTRQLSETREYFSRKDAIRTHGLETVQEAYKWLETATHAGDPKIGPLLQRITSSIDPFDEVVTAFKRDRAISTVGDDPNAWFDKELERRLASDPEFKAKFQPAADQQQQNGAAPPIPVVKLPPSLNRQPGAAQAPSNAGTDDKSLYAFATS